MRENAKTCKRREIEQLTTQQLEKMLQKEIEKETPDENIVVPILEVLEERDAGQPVEVSERAAAAWKKYQERISTPRLFTVGKKKTWIGKFAGIAAVVALIVLAAPFAVDANGTLDVLYRMTENVVEFFSPGGGNIDTVGEYVFETDNPGLQQVYDKVVELGVTEPVVPMWLPDGYELGELEEIPVPGGVKLYAKFEKDDSVISIQFKVFEAITSTQYERENVIEEYEAAGEKHLVYKNTDSFGAVWVADNVECMISTAAQIEDVYDMIKSIYRRK